MIADSNFRSLIKGVTWRVTGTIDTMIMAYIVTGHLNNAIKIGLTEVLTKIVLYYLHERLWNTIRFGRVKSGPTHGRSFTKGVSWRAVGTMDTMIISYFFTHSSLSALKIGGFEVFSKIALYYIHERIWAKIKWGRVTTVSPPSEELPVAAPAQSPALVKVEQKV
jgi:uncharacterized membrane protein